MSAVDKFNYLIVVPDITMDYAGDWFHNPRIHWQLVQQHEEQAKAAKKEKEEKERRKIEARLKKNYEQDQARAENGRNNFDEHGNPLNMLFHLVKAEFLEDKPATPKFISMNDYAKSKNRPVEDVKGRLTTTMQPHTNKMLPERTFAPTQRAPRLRESSSDLSAVYPNNFGTRTFIPMFMVFVASVSIIMVLLGIARWFLHQKSRETRRSEKKTSRREGSIAFPAEGYKFCTYEPSAPAELELEHFNVIPGVHTRQEVTARAITDLRLKYHAAVSAQKNGNSKSLMPLLEHVFGRGNECENCRQPLSSQRCYPNYNNRI